MIGDVVLYTANYGGRDSWHPPVEQDVACSYVAYTDGDRAPYPWVWTRRARPPTSIQHPNMQAKWFKTHPPVADDEIAIWVDASMEITSPAFVREAVDALAESCVAVFEHPRRSRVADEVDASLGAEGQGGRYSTLPLRAQLEHYRQLGFTDRWGLYACGVIVWGSGIVARSLGHRWFIECERWGYQDQISFPYVCWRTGVRPATFPGPLIEAHGPDGLSNRWLTIHPHRPGTA